MELHSDTQPAPFALLLVLVALLLGLSVAHTAYPALLRGLPSSLVLHRFGSNPKKSRVRTRDLGSESSLF